MPITAKILADSVNPAGSRLTTLELCLPLAFWPQVLTHRVFSRNARSMRAVPVEKLIAEVKADPYIPIKWAANKRGMVAGEPLSPGEAEAARAAWVGGRDEVVNVARFLARCGVHKQWASRWLVPVAHIHAVVSSTEWGNFFAQRLPDDAQPEMQALALAMGRAMLASEPRALAWGEWHLPYVTQGERDHIGYPEVLGISAARCARVSYKPFDSERSDVAADIDLARRLRESGHWSPFEHQAKAVDQGVNYRRRSNFGCVWMQQRKAFDGENRRDFDWQAAIAAAEGR